MDKKYNKSHGDPKIQKEFQNKSKSLSEKISFYCKMKISPANSSPLVAVSVPDTDSSRIQNFRQKFSFFATKSTFRTGSKQIKKAFTESETDEELIKNMEKIGFTYFDDEES